MYGDTRRIPNAIGAGLKDRLDVRVVPVSHAEPKGIADADLVVVGGPTHVHGMSRASTRQGGCPGPDKPIGGLTSSRTRWARGESWSVARRPPVRAAAFLSSASRTGSNCSRAYTAVLTEFE